MEIEGGASGVTLNLSASGIAFESAKMLRPGETITLMIVIPSGATTSQPRLRCRAKVIRVEKSRRVERARETIRVGATVQWLGSGTRAEWFDLVSEYRATA